VHGDAVVTYLVAEAQHTRRILRTKNSLQVEQFDDEPVLEHLDRFTRREEQIGRVAERAVAALVRMTALLAVPVFQAAGTESVETRKHIRVSKQLLAQRTDRYVVRLFH